MNRYGAIPSQNGKYKVVKISCMGTFSPLLYREFDTWDEADQVAKDTAKGLYEYKPGQYINMR